MDVEVKSFVGLRMWWIEEPLLVSLIQKQSVIVPIGSIFIVDVLLRKLRPVQSLPSITTIAKVKTTTLMKMKELTLAVKMSQLNRLRKSSGGSESNRSLGFLRRSVGAMRS